MIVLPDNAIKSWSMEIDGIPFPPKPLAGQIHWVEVTIYPSGECEVEIGDKWMDLGIKMVYQGTNATFEDAANIPKELAGAAKDVLDGQASALATRGTPSGRLLLSWAKHEAKAKKKKRAGRRAQRRARRGNRT